MTHVKPGDFANCGNQYWSGGPANNWSGVALDPAKVWSDRATDPTANTAGINSRYALVLGGVAPTKTFLIDTSRNGQGPWTPTGAQAAWPDPQAWCNPLGRGLGQRPSTRTGTPLADAYVWLKVPGESDGQCSRGLGSGNDVVDPSAGRSTRPPVSGSTTRRCNWPGSPVRRWLRAADHGPAESART